MLEGISFPKEMNSTWCGSCVSEKCKGRDIKKKNDRFLFGYTVG